VSVFDPEHPYAVRDDAALLAELNQLSRRHLAGCPPYKNVWPEWREARDLAELPFLHAGVFKYVRFRTEAPDIKHERTLKSSATTSGKSSMISLDRESSELQSASTLAILRDFVGSKQRPLLVLDSSKSLLARGEVSARVAAALSLKPLATEIHFLLDDAADADSMRWEALEGLLKAHDDLLVYGFTWILWLAWLKAKRPENIAKLLKGKRIAFVHSGGWKKLEALKVERSEFDQALLKDLDSQSKVVDYYGLVEQVGIIYPLCEAGYRHVPRWAEVIVRDPWTLQPLSGEDGQLQLLNTLARGAPYHSVLTEDVGRVVAGDCPCGRKGRRFLLQGRVPKSEVRGCANV
jgi:phenylacetate-coenzyme A ligase PaaK-like adenylate-forming protein